MPTGIDDVTAQVTNFTWSAFFGLLLTVINGTAVGIWLRTRPKMKELDQSADDRLRDSLLARVEKLESDLTAQRVFYEDKLDKLTAAHDAKFEKLQAEYEGAAQIARHELANAKMRFRALVMLLKRLPNPPEGLTAILADIEAMEAEQARAEAAEKGARAGAKIAGTGAMP